MIMTSVGSYGTLFSTRLIYQWGILMRSKRLLSSFLFFFGSKLAGFCKLSFMIGSYATFFSATNCIVPLAGAFCGMFGSTVLFACAFLMRMIFAGGLLPVFSLVHMVPGLCAGYYWASRSAAIRLFIPFLCMVLFILHPVGGAAWYYALYWLIPMLIYLYRTDHLFLTALGSTFTAHAVGSVIWLYMVPMSVANWHMLIPVVLIERLLMAGGMVLMHMLISWATRAVLVRRTKQAVSVA